MSRPCQPKCEVETTQLTSSPFKKMRKIRNSHSSSVFDCESVLFPDGKMKAVTCSDDETLRIFDLKTLECEKIINHTSELFSIHFYKEEQLLMTTDRNGELCFWKYFSSEQKYQNFKEIILAAPVSRFLNASSSRNTIFFVTGYIDYSLYSLNLGTHKIIKNVEKIHDKWIKRVKWIDEVEGKSKFF